MFPLSIANVSISVNKIILIFEGINRKDILQTVKETDLTSDN